MPMEGRCKLNTLRTSVGAREIHWTTELNLAEEHHW